MDYRCWSTRGSKLMSRRAAGSFEEDVRRYSTGSPRASAGCAGLACVRVTGDRVGLVQRAPFATSLRWTLLWLERRYSPNREQSSLTQSTVYNSSETRRRIIGRIIFHLSALRRPVVSSRHRALAPEAGSTHRLVRRAFPWRLVTTTFLVPPRAWMKSTSTCERTRAQMYAGVDSRTVIDPFVSSLDSACGLEVRPRR